jgi:hypothetical protein
MKLTLHAALAVAAFGAALQATPAAAQTRVFVAAQGSDANPCTFAQPCRTFQHAHDVVAANGEIDVLDPAGYGQLTIAKAISIQGHGFAGISVAHNGASVRVKAGADDFVTLNGLLIEGNRDGEAGIDFSSGKSLAVVNCVVRNMRLTGLVMQSLADTAEALAVSNSYFTDNGQTGIAIAALRGGAVTAAIERTGMFGNATGLSALAIAGAATLDVAVGDSVAANHPGVGFFVGSEAGGPTANLTLTHATAVGNGIGVRAGTNATLRLAQSTVTGNQIGYAAQDGVVVSYGDNYLDGNRSNATALGAATRR